MSNESEPSWEQADPTFPYLDDQPRTVTDMQMDVGPGWRPLLVELHAQLVEAGFSYEALQVKEKFAILRVYISVQGEWHPTFDLTVPGQGTVTGTMTEGSGTYSRAMEIVHAAEERSRTICEDCGEPGVLRTDRFWLRTLCNACNEVHPHGIIPSPPVVTD